MSGRCLGDISSWVHHSDLSNLFASLLLSGNGLAVHAHLRILTGIGARGSLTSRVRIHLRVEHEHVNVHTRRQQTR